MKDQITKDPSLATRNQIINAARKVFTQHGYTGARMQQIADEAKINKALLHYHFKNKNTLFERILFEAMQTIKSTIFDVLNSDIPLFEKIRVFCSVYMSLLQKNRFFIRFVVTEIDRDPERLLELSEEAGFNTPVIIIQQIQEEVARGKIIEISPRQLIINMLSMSIFPFIGRPILQFVLNIDDPDFEQLIEERKVLIPELIIRSIIKKNPDEQ